MKEFDIKISVKFCLKHKEFLEKNVFIKSGNQRCVRLNELTSLLKESEVCIDCQWETIFGKEKKELETRNI